MYASGTLARYVQAAQYELAANRGFFSWWPNWGWRFFMGWWHAAFSKGGEAKLDAMVDTARPTARHVVIKESHELHEIGAAGYEEVGEFAIGMIEALSNEGYKAVAESRSERGMINFMYRVLAQEGLEVVDNETLYDVVKFYDGECATQTYTNLVAELHRARHPYLCHQAWVAKAGEQPAGDDTRLAALAQLGEAVITSSSHRFGEPSMARIGSTATLDESGYQAVARAQSTAETTMFIERVLAKLNLKVSDKSGLHSFVPYYSSECARQSYYRLVKELKRAPTLPQSCGGGWVSDA